MFFQALSVFFPPSPLSLSLFLPLSLSNCPTLSLVIKAFDHNLVTLFVCDVRVHPSNQGGEERGECFQDAKQQRKKGKQKSVVCDYKRYINYSN